MRSNATRRSAPRIRTTRPGSRLTPGDDRTQEQIERDPPIDDLTERGFANAEELPDDLDRRSQRSPRSHEEYDDLGYPIDSLGLESVVP